MPSAWVQHVQAVYRKKKAKNASYKYGQAMKDAKATYKKGSKSSNDAAEEAPKKRRRRKKKSRMSKEEEE